MTTPSAGEGVEKLDHRPLLGAGRGEMENEQPPGESARLSYTYSPATGLLGLSQSNGDPSTLTWTHTLTCNSQARKNQNLLQQVKG